MRVSNEDENRLIEGVIVALIIMSVVLYVIRHWT